MENLIKVNKEFKVKDFETKYFEFIDVTSKTRETYLDGISSFIQYVDNNQIVNPTREDVINWRNYLRVNYSSSTVNTYLVGLKSFFAFLDMFGLYPNITNYVKGAKITTTPKKNVMTLEQVQKIYHNLNDLREKALFSLLITTGLRGIEVSNAKIEDITKVNDENVLYVQCKGHTEKDEYVKLADNVYQDILNYIGDRKSGYIFISTSKNNYGEGVTTKTIRCIIREIYKRFGLENENMSLHSTRRSCACISYNLGQSIYDIQQVLHHKSINTTTRYLKAVDRNNNRTENIVANAMI